MVRTPKTPAPSRRDIRRSVMGGLNMQSGLTRSAVVGITFEPTVGIAAGRIAKLGVDIRSFREPLSRAIKQVVIPSIQANFNAGGRPEWEPLSDFTLKRHAEEGGSGPLIKTGKLKKTMAQFNIWTITPTMAILADLPERVWYGKVQQAGYEGAGAGRRVRQGSRSARQTLEDITDAALTGRGTGGSVVPPIPARPFVMLQPEDEDKIMIIFIKWLEERVVRSWPGVHF
jgi:phage gpG-like protein